MRYASVTLNDEDVEFFDPSDEVRAALFDSDLFEVWVDGEGLEAALIAVHKFHRQVANRMIAADVTNVNVPKWARELIPTCRRAKWHRNELRRRFQSTNGAGALAALTLRLDLEFPRTRPHH